MTGTIQLQQLHKTFGSTVIIDEVNLTVPAGSFTCVLGKSGEGKSVLLKMIIGLIAPTSGTISIDNCVLESIPTAKRQELLRTCGYVFQFAALLDSLTIEENICITLPEATAPDIRRNVAINALQQVGLDEILLPKFPSDLSGGMKKRVGIARTLVQKPRIILYDEPTTGLDPLSTRQIHEVMKTVQLSGVTTLVVSHDTGILNYADYVAVLEDGCVSYFGPTQDALESEHHFLKAFMHAARPFGSHQSLLN